MEEMAPTETRDPKNMNNYLQSSTPEMPQIEEMAQTENRDPKDMNNYLQFLWEDTVAEPEGIRSKDCVWKSAFQVYRWSLGCCYGILTIIFAIPIAFCIGLNFACLAFQV